LMPSARERLRTTVRAASTDSFITSPERTGALDDALAGHQRAFDRQQVAADFGPREADHLADLVLLLGAP
jgi:hypothetical protein